MEKITVQSLRDGSLNVRVAKVTGAHRYSLQPASLVDGAWVRTDVSNEPVGVQEAAAAAWSEDVVRDHIDAMLALEPPAPTREELRSAALERVSLAHAIFMRKLTGGATVEERDTWKTKEEAARDHVAGTATDIQTEMLHLEATARGVDLDDLSQTILAKAASFKRLIGAASALRVQAIAAVERAASEAVPVADIPAAIEAVEAQIADKAEQAIKKWVAAN